MICCCVCVSVCLATVPNVYSTVPKLQRKDFLGKKKKNKLLLTSSVLLVGIDWNWIEREKERERERNKDFLPFYFFPFCGGGKEESTY